MYALSRLNLRGIIVSFFTGFYDFSEDENLVEIRKVLREIRTGLGQARHARDPLESLVCFVGVVVRGEREIFARIGPIQNLDRNRYGKVFERTMEIWRTLAEFKQRMGDLHPGSGLAADEHNVYLGKTYGLPVLSLSQWRAKENDAPPELGWRDPRFGRFNEYHVVVLQASEIVNDWSRMILQKIRLAETIIGYLER